MIGRISINVCVFFLFFLIAGVNLSSAEELVPYSLTNPPPVGGMNADKPDFDLDSQNLVLTPKLFDYENIPQSTGFDYPVGGASNGDDFEMVNCFGCTYTWMVGHTAEDFYNGRAGDPVYSASEGVVIYRGPGGGGWGNVIIIQHNVRGRSIYTQYAHMQEMYVEPGQVVGRRQQIAIVGATGTEVPHLHFEVKDQPVIGHGYAGWSFSGVTVFVGGINYYAPSWYIDNNRHIESPFGNIDSTVMSPGKYSISGWAIDPDVSDSIYVHMYLDGQIVAVAFANENRPDLETYFPASGPYHGFSAEIDTPPGEHTLCVYGINVGSGHNNLISCAAMNYPSAMGNLDRVSLTSPNQLSLGGWAIDPDVTDPINVHLYVDGRYITAFTAGGTRPDVGTVYPGYGDNHGYSAQISNVSPGLHTVCTYAINVGAGDTNPLLGCRVIDVPVNPIGNLEGVTAGALGQIDVGGWAIDPDTTESIQVHIYVNGRWGGAFTAGGTRPDVGGAYPGYGDNHGFSGSVRANDAANTVCAYGINVGAGDTNSLLGCKVIDVPVNPIGNLDGVSVGAPGELNVGGWAIDPDTTDPIQVHIYVNGRWGGAFTAGGNRPDVGGAYPGYGDNHGFSGTVAAAASDSYRVCAYGINVGPGDTNPLLGCRTT